MRALVVGDLVRMKCGGPIMVVVGFSEEIPIAIADITIVARYFNAISGMLVEVKVPHGALMLSQ